MRSTTPYNGSNEVIIGNRASLPIANIGQVTLPTPHPNTNLQNILHVPTLSHNLLAIHQLISNNNCTISLDNNGFIKD